ncbi:hypothetical protein NMY22_g12118 [Coprinellus aureogranulatus]|nr:hypothetical protein NMY22_g12118 [Coprinellus aureogranulatus]
MFSLPSIRALCEQAWSFVWGASPEKYVTIVGPGLQAEAGKTLVHHLETGEYAPQNPALHPERHEHVKIGAATVTILLPGGAEHSRRLFEHAQMEGKGSYDGVIYVMPTDPETIALYKSEMTTFLVEAAPVPTLVLLVYKNKKPSEEDVSTELGFTDRTNAATDEGFLTFTRPAFAEPSDHGRLNCRRINLNPLLTSNSLLHRDAIAAGDGTLQMDERRKAQLDLEARITELELEVCDLKRKRNALLPISQLPPELLCEILSFDTVTFAEDDFKSPPANPVPKTLGFCHVSYLWRSIVLDCPKMWTYIKVGKGTEPECLHFMWKNTGVAVVQMNIDSSMGWVRKSLGTPIAIKLVADISSAASD